MMQNQLMAILALPEEGEIERTEEIRVNRGRIFKKTIHYRNGIVAVLLKDMNNNVFHIELRSPRVPFWMSRNHLFLIPSQG